MKIIVLNGPPGSGKTTMQGYLYAKYSGIYKESFANPLVTLVQSFYGIKNEDWCRWYSPEGKSLKRPLLEGKSCREALIHVSENIIKPMFGKDVFGRLMADRLYGLPKGANVVIDDGGFEEEITPLIEEFGKENIFCVKIERDGHSYEGDSRKDLPEDLFAHTFHLCNNTLGCNDVSLKKQWNDIMSKISVC